jgi:metal-sulfur cluster biosynthetic enzyme
MSQDIQQTRRLIFDELSKIVDPEIGVSIMELELVDQVDIKEKDVNVDLHLTSPFCPAVFGFKIAQDVRDNIYRIHGIENVKINVSNHFMAEAINKQVNESKPPSKQQQEEIEVEGEGEKEQEQEQEKPMNERKQQ